jgi:hypothetical protein
MPLVAIACLAEVFTPFLLMDQFVLVEVADCKWLLMVNLVDAPLVPLLPTLLDAVVEPARITDLDVAAPCATCKWKAVTPSALLTFTRFENVFLGTGGGVT